MQINKKQRMVMGVSIIVMLLGYLAFSSGIVSNMYEVRQAVASKQNLTNSIIIINGTLVKGSDHWDSINRTWLFKMTDNIAIIDVVYKGEKPDVPPQAENVQVIVTGQFNDSVFVAIKKPLTKCPSKYEASTRNLANNK